MGFSLIDRGFYPACDEILPIKFPCWRSSACRQQIRGVEVGQARVTEWTLDCQWIKAAQPALRAALTGLPGLLEVCMQCTGNDAEQRFEKLALAYYDCAFTGQAQ